MVFSRSNLFVIIFFVLELLAVLIAAGVNMDGIAWPIFGMGGLASFALSLLVP